MVKYITKKWIPINQIFLHSCEEIRTGFDVSNFIDGHDKEKITINARLNKVVLSTGLLPKYDKYDPLRIVLGEETITRIAAANTFIVGAGAIGCELIKNISMIGLGRNGVVTLTDPDIIENSNLNR